MPLFAPAGPAVRALFYSQLATFAEAGVPVLRALEQLARNPPHRRLRPLAHTLLASVGQGGTFTDAFRHPASHTPVFDIALIDAGERSGRLDQVFATLARHHRASAENLSAVRQECIYPALVLHLAIFIAPLPAWFQTGSTAGYLLHTLAPLAMLYGALAFLAWALQGSRHEAWRATLERILVRVPLLGAARADLALARLAGALEALVSAGVLVTAAWPLAAEASGSPLLRQTVDGWRPDLEAGHPPGDQVARAGVFPDLFVSSYLTGEMSGRLDHQLAWLARYHEEQGFARMRAVSRWAPRILYGFIALWVALQILRLAAGYVGTLNQLLAE